MLKIDPEVERSQIESLSNLRSRRNDTEVRAALERLRGATARDENVMPCILNAVRAYATVGEMSEAMKTELGAYREPAFV